MTITTLTDGSGQWFNLDRAVCYKETTRWDGNNHISLVTGSQWNHEWLYVTAGKRFILNSFSDWQGSTETYEEISKEEAAVWFARNELEPIGLIEEEFNALEIT